MTSASTSKQILTQPSLSAVRFEPGETKTISLIPIGGNNLIDGPVAEPGNPPAAFMEKIKALGFHDSPEASVREARQATISRSTYSKTYGPTVGDRIRLGDTALVVEVEHDFAAP